MPATQVTLKEWGNKPPLYKDIKQSRSSSPSTVHTTLHDGIKASSCISKVSKEASNPVISALKVIVLAFKIKMFEFPAHIHVYHKQAFSLPTTTLIGPVLV